MGAIPILLSTNTMLMIGAIRPSPINMRDDVAFEFGCLDLL